MKRFHLSGERSAEGVSVDDVALRGKPVPPSRTVSQFSPSYIRTVKELRTRGRTGMAIVKNIQDHPTRNALGVHNLSIPAVLSA
ncbi:MAG: hypothetical protein ACR2OU_08860 [Thermomicrobiales bacterium]